MGDIYGMLKADKRWGFASLPETIVFGRRSLAFDLLNIHCVVFPAFEGGI